MNLDNRGLLDISKMAGTGKTYLLPDGSVLKQPEDIDLIPRIMEELEARRMYGQPCERIELGPEAWAWAFYHSLKFYDDPIGVRLRMDVPSVVLLCGLIASLNADIPPTCFEVF